MVHGPWASIPALTSLPVQPSQTERTVITPVDAMTSFSGH